MDPDLSPDEIKAYQQKQSAVFKGTIAVCVVYAVIALSLFLIMTFNEKARALLSENMFSFTATLMGGMIFIIIVLIIEILSFKMPRALVKSDGLFCPDYWVMEQTPENVLKQFPAESRALMTHSCVPDPSTFGKEYRVSESLIDRVYVSSNELPPTFADTAALESWWTTTSNASDLTRVTRYEVSAPERAFEKSDDTLYDTNWRPGTFSLDNVVRVIIGYFKSNVATQVSMASRFNGIMQLKVDGELVMLRADASSNSNPDLYARNGKSIPANKLIRFEYRMIGCSCQETYLKFAPSNNATLTFHHTAEDELVDTKVDLVDEFNKKYRPDISYRMGCGSRIYPLYLNGADITQDNSTSKTASTKTFNNIKRCALIEQCNANAGNNVLSWSSVC